MSLLAKMLMTLLMCCLLQVPVAVAKGKHVDKSQAVQAAKRKYPGKVIKISNGKRHYQVRLLQKDGRVVTVKVDKASGKVIQSGKHRKGR